jgi:hypothetical protein
MVLSFQQQSRDSVQKTLEFDAPTSKRRIPTLSNVARTCYAIFSPIFSAIFSKKTARVAHSMENEQHKEVLDGVR